MHNSFPESAITKSFIKLVIKIIFLMLQENHIGTSDLKHRTTISQTNGLKVAKERIRV